MVESAIFAGIKIRFFSLQSIMFMSQVQPSGHETSMSHLDSLVAKIFQNLYNLDKLSQNFSLLPSPLQFSSSALSFATSCSPAVNDMKHLVSIASFGFLRSQSLSHLILQLHSSLLLWMRLHRFKLIFSINNIYQI